MTKPTKTLPSMKTEKGHTLESSQEMISLEELQRSTAATE